MGRLLKYLTYLIILGGIGLVGYAYIGPILGVDFAPAQTSIVEPVTLSLK